MQDLDWDHLPTVGWAVVGDGFEAVLDEERDGLLVAADSQRARKLGVIEAAGVLAEHRLPAIVE